MKQHDEDEILIESPPLEEILEDIGIDSDGTKELILINDDVNSFESVIIAIVEICGHNIKEATAKALEAHTKGEAVVLEGREETLKTKASEFNRRGIGAKIE